LFSDLGWFIDEDLRQINKKTWSSAIKWEEKEPGRNLVFSSVGFRGFEIIRRGVGERRNVDDKNSPSYELAEIAKICK
jgi:hypothetical protein